MNRSMACRSLALADIRIVGAGSIGRQYLSCLPAKSSGSRFVVSASGRNLRTSSLTYTLQEDYQSTERVPVDLCVIATRTRGHVDDALKFGPSSRRLLVEKPVAGSLAEAKVLTKTGARLPADTFVASPLRFMAGFAEVRRLLPQVGDTKRVDIVCESWLPNWRPMSDYRNSYSAAVGEGGVLLDLVHEIDYALALFGRPEAVAATLSAAPSLDIPVESHANVTWRYRKFDLGLRLSFASRHHTRTLVVQGTEGILKWDLLAGSISFKGPTNSPPFLQHFPRDLDRPWILRRQLGAALGTQVGEAPATMADGLMALHLVDLAKASHESASRELEVQKSADFQ